MRTPGIEFLMSDKVDLISKLLAKAESTTPEEAEALREAAMKLMVRHGITEAMLQSTGKAAREDIVCRDVWINSCYASEFRDMAFRVTRSNPRYVSYVRRLQRAIDARR